MTAGLTYPLLPPTTTRAYLPTCVEGSCLVRCFHQCHDRLRSKYHCCNNRIVSSRDVEFRCFHFEVRNSDKFRNWNSMEFQSYLFMNEN
jgi:hypothetical protein